MDGVASSLFHKNYDKGGEIASKGTVSTELLKLMMKRGEEVCCCCYCC